MFLSMQRGVSVEEFARVSGGGGVNGGEVGAL